MYKAGFDKVEEVKVIKETECFLILENGRRESKESIYFTYFNTFEEAKIHIVQKKYRSLEKCKSDLKSAEEELAKAQNLQPKIELAGVAEW